MAWCCWNIEQLSLSPPDLCQLVLCTYHLNGAGVFITVSNVWDQTFQSFSELTPEPSTPTETNETPSVDDMPSTMSELAQSAKLKDPLEYNPNDYKHLNASPEIHDLLKYIERYKGKKIDLETKLKPFIPDYIPAIGDADEFIKVPRPDGAQDFLGLKVTAWHATGTASLRKGQKKFQADFSPSVSSTSSIGNRCLMNQDPSSLNRQY